MPRPPHVARHLASIPGSVYSALAGRLARHEGETYPLHVGDNWMEPPVGTRMQDLSVADYPGMHRYTSVHGMPELLDAIVEREREKTGLAIERENVLVAAGATGGLGAVAGAILDGGDEVLILAPYWPLIEGIVRSFHGTPVAVPVLGGEVDSADGAVAAAEALRTERSVALYLSTPNNPSGRVLPRAWVEALVAWAARHDLWIVTDEVYEAFLYQGEPVRALPLAPERTFLAQTFSKCYGMTGNRCGYVVGPREVMGELRKVSTHTFYSTPTASQIAALRALRGPGDAWAREVCAQYKETGRRCAERLGVPAPEGSTFLFLDVADALDHPDEGGHSASGLDGLLERCLERGLLVAPGPSFGPYESHIRLCYTAVEPERALRGVGVLAEILGR